LGTSAETNSKFRISIVRPDGYQVLMYPGSRGERDLVADIVERTLAKGVGVFRSEAHVKADLEAAITESLQALKSEIVPHAI
jgi:hypothetical protein